MIRRPPPGPGWPPRTRRPQLGTIRLYKAQEATCLFDNWFAPIEAGLRERVRGFIETMLETELDAVLARPRYGRHRAMRDEHEDAAGVTGHRHGHRARTLTGTFGTTEIAVPRARLEAGDGKTASKALRAYQRRTMAADALIASVYLAGTNTSVRCTDMRP